MLEYAGLVYVTESQISCISRLRPIAENNTGSSITTLECSTWEVYPHVSTMRFWSQGCSDLSDCRLEGITAMSALESCDGQVIETRKVGKLPGMPSDLINSIFRVGENRRCLW